MKSELVSARRLGRRVKFVYSVVTCFVLAAVSPVPASLLDDFEDGDYTTDPVWTLYNQQGDANIVADPIRPDNLVVAMFGSLEGQHTLQTDMAAPFYGFDVSADVLISDSSCYPTVQLRNWATITTIGVGIYPDHVPPQLMIYEDNRHWGGVETSHWVDISALPLNTWLRLRLWHDPAAGLLRAEIRLVSDGSLLAEHSAIPTLDILNIPPISVAYIGAARQPLTYIDNIRFSSPGACAFDDRTCVTHFSETECAAQSGTYRGDATRCAAWENVPAVSSVGLAVLVMVLLGAGGVVIRKRRLHISEA